MNQIFTAFVLITIGMLACKKDKKALPALTTTAATNVTANSITTGGNITDDGNSGITQRGIAWADHAAPTVADSITKDGTGSGAFTSTISYLNANTTYYLRAYAINASGTAYGNEISVKTSNGAPTVTTTAITDIQPLSAVSGGNVTNDGGATVTERGIVYATTANPTITNFKITSGTGTGTFTATLSPLASQTTYYVRAYATNSFGTAYGNQVQFNAASANTVTDVDGNVYSYVTICGGKSWMATNLRTTKYKNGDAVTNGTTGGFDWTSAVGAYGYPNGNISNEPTYGKLYNNYAISDSRGICPTGWHVPSDDEWKALEVCQGMTQADADGSNWRGTIAPKLKEGGTSGLNLQLGGFLGNGAPFQFGVYGEFATSTLALDPNFFYQRRVAKTGDPNEMAVYRSFSSTARSVRCVKD
jgi:uncharacterized protein (TIGR02145 family)